MDKKTVVKNPLAPKMIKHVGQFMKKARLFPAPQAKAFVAVSGGADSMALLHMLAQLRDQGAMREVLCLHVNHRTRPENEKEEKLVRDECQKLQIPCLVKHWEEKKSFTNFEAKARQVRQEFFLQHACGSGDRIYTAHHIDDSFEWSLLSSFRSSSMRPTLGIPVRHGKLARPFLCLTRKQIRKFIRERGIAFCEDPSNFSLHHERNYLRHSLIAQIAQKWPQYLKHYVYRSNDLARRLGVSVFQERDKGPFQIRRQKDILGGEVWSVVPFGSDLRAFEEDLLQAVQAKSETGRGVLRTQLKKLLEALPQGKWGPLLFSGKVWGYMAPSQVLLLRDKQKEIYLSWDHRLAQYLRAHLDSPEGKAQIPGVRVLGLPELKQRWEQELELFPSLILSWRPVPGIPGMKRIYPLFPQTTQLLLDKGVWFQAIPQIFKLGKNSAHFKSLKVDLQCLVDILLAMQSGAIISPRNEIKV